MTCAQPFDPVRTGMTVNEHSRAASSSPATVPTATAASARQLESPSLRGSRAQHGADTTAGSDGYLLALRARPVADPYPAPAAPPP